VHFVDKAVEKPGKTSEQAGITVRYVDKPVENKE
jgi:hypothetical protein